MEALVKVENNQIVTDSRSVAEHFGKEHAKVIRSIEGIISETPKVASQKMFYKTTYKVEGNNKSYKMYLMNRNGFSLLVMGFTGARAMEWKLRYIDAFNEMETQLVKKNILTLPDFTNPVEAARAWANEYEAKQKALTENAEMKPKADFYDTVANTESLFSMADVAKTLDMGIGRNKLFAFLRDKGILDKDNHPYQKYVDAGYMRLIENHCKAGDNDVVYKCTYVKQRGIDYIRKILLKERGLDENMG